MGHQLEGSGREFHGKLPSADVPCRHHRRRVQAGRDGLPDGFDAFNYHWIIKNDSVPLALAHPSNTTLHGDARRTTWLLAIYPSLLITLTPGYFWYLSLTPNGPGRVNVLFGGGMSPDWMADPDAPAHLAAVKALLDDVNVEDKGCTEKVYRGLVAGLSQPGPLSHLERPNFEFARYIASRIPA